MAKAKDIKTISDLKPQVRNSNKHTQRGLGLLQDSIQKNGWIGAITVAADGETFDGSARIEVGADAGFDDAIIVRSDGSKPVVHIREDIKTADDPKAKILGVSANRIAEIDFDPDVEVLAELADDGIELGQLYSDDELSALLAGLETKDIEGNDSEAANRTLAERFGVPPFSVLDARQGYWQERKRAWLALEIRGEVGRDALAGGGGTSASSCYLIKRNDGSSATSGELHGTEDANCSSIFDPALCELAYRWFSTEGGSVLDPFAGGSVRGIVAARLGRHYTGVDLRAEQVAANEVQAAEIVPENPPRWITGDSLQVVPQIEGEFDFIFSCPPYADLEVYSDDPQDLSTMDYAAFIVAYRAIIAASVAKLKDNRFACFVVGDVRDKKGFYRNFVSDTISAFEDAGAQLYNEAILVTSVGSLPIRVGKQFDGGRKLGKTHQNVLVFYKGDPKQIKSAFGACDFGAAEEELTD